MLGESLRFPWLVALVVAPLALALPSPAEQTAIHCLDLPLAEARPSKTPPHAGDPKARANALYLQGDLAGAVAEVRASDPDLAELYDQFRRGWLTAFDPDSTPGDAFPAVREAWKLDTVLGGAFTDVLFAKSRELAPLAAEQYVRQGRDEEALQASNAALMLGHEVYK